MTDPKKPTDDSWNTWYCPDCEKLHDPRIYCLDRIKRLFPALKTPIDKEKPSR